MVYEFKLPDVGEGIAEGEIVKWFVEKNQKIAEEQPIAEVQTDKALIEITSPVYGTVKEILFEEGEIAKVDSVIISFITEEAEVKAVKENPPSSLQVNRDEGKTSYTTESFQPNKGRKRVIATPTVRRIARELNINLLMVKGSGKNGRVLKEDVYAYVDPSEKTAPPPVNKSLPTVEPVPQLKGSFDPVLPQEKSHASEERVPLRGLRRSISNKMTTSTTVAAQSTIFEEIDVTRLVDLRKNMKEQAKERGKHLTYLPFVIKAVILALRKFPYLNSSLDDDLQEIVLKYNYNIGIATNTENGLMVPVVKSADQKTLLHLSTKISELAEKARNQKLSLDEMSEGTFTISNIGSTGVGLFGTPIINHPEAAILAIHRIQKKPVVVEDNQIEIRDMLGLSLSFDHRIVDGAMASYFLKEVIQYLENPNLMFMEMM